MTTFKAVVDHRKADGTYCVKIRITHNRKALYHPTSYFVTDSQLTRSKKIKDPNVLHATDKLITEMRTAVMEIDGVADMPVEILRSVLMERLTRGKTFRLNFVNYAREKIKVLNLRNARSHDTAINYIEKMFGDKIDINEITYNKVVAYRDELLSRGLSPNTVAKYLTKIKHIINLAKDEYNDDYNTRVTVSPFRRNVMPVTEPTEHRVLSAEQIRRIATIKGDRYENFARDVFLLSFCLVGINLVDLYYLPTNALDGDFLTYSRQKTGGRRKDKAIITIRVEEEARRLIERYRGDDVYLLNFFRRYKNHEKMTHGVNVPLKRLHNYEPSLPSGLTYYYARHSWATIAYNDCGIDMQTIHEALNHASSSEMKITDVYVKKDFSRIWEANRKVLNYVFGNGKE